MTQIVARIAAGIAALGALVISACGGDGNANNPPDCELFITVETDQPTVGQSVTARVTSDVLGFLDATWSLELDSQAISCSDEASGLCEGQSIAFLPTEAGSYQLRVSGDVDGATCIGKVAMISVEAPGANRASYRIRVTPSSAGASVQEIEREIPGGADYFIGDLLLSLGVSAQGTVFDAAGSGAAAHLRAVDADFAADGFASSSGAYALSLPSGTFDVDVFPGDPSIAPLRLLQQSASGLGDISLSAGDTVTGQVTGPGGAPLVGARAILSHDLLPSTVGVVGGGGAFSVATRPGGAAELSITAPAGSGLPILEGAAAGVAAGSDLAVSYSAASTLVARTFRVETSAGAPVSGARVTFTSEAINAAGAVSVDGGGAQGMTGRVQQTAISNGSGDASIALPDASYSIVIDAPGLELTMLSLDLNGGAAPDLAVAAAPSGWSATIVDAGGAPIEGAVVSARPAGALGAHPGASTAAVSAADGTVVLDLVGNGSYQIQIDPPIGAAARLQRGSVVALPSGVDAVGAVTVPASQRVNGTVTLPSGSTASLAHIAFFCTACATPDIPVAETLSDFTGRWVIALPDAGVGLP